MSSTPAPGLAEVHGVAPSSTNATTAMGSVLGDSGGPEGRCGACEETGAGEQKTTSCFPF